MNKPKPPLPEKASLSFETTLGLRFPAPEPPLREVPTWLSKKTGRSRIPVHWPSILNDELLRVIDVTKSGWISSLGPEVKRFEEDFAKFIGTRFAISCTSGTAALHLALAALGIGPGDEVITPTFSMVASTNAILYCGATPVLIDCEPHTYDMTPDLVEWALKERCSSAKAIMPVHIYGYPCDMYGIMKIAEEHGLWVVEDCAESHGALYGGKVCGSIGNVGVFSLYANKLVTTGEGGMVTTDNEEIAELVRTLMNHAFSKERHFCHRLLGFNYRMTALQAAVGRAQIARWDQMQQQRVAWQARYREGLKDLTWLKLPPANQGAVRSVIWMYAIVVRPNIDRDKLRYYLAARGIETRNFFVPMHLQPVHYERFKGQRFPVSEDLMQRGFYLPSATELTHDEVDYICTVLAGFGQR